MVKKFLLFISATSIDANADADADADRHDRAQDNDDNAPSSAEHSGGWIQFAITVGWLCKSKSLECSTRLTGSMTVFGNDTVTGGGDDDRIFELVVKSSRGDRWEFCLRGRQQRRRRRRGSPRERWNSGWPSVR